MDPIADMLSQIQNAARAGQETVTVPFSTHKKAIAENLAAHGYLEAVELSGEEPHAELVITLAYDQNGAARIRGARRVSKLSRRVYQKAKNLASYKRGYGDRFVSTPRGVMSDSQAREANVGGEVLFEIW